MTIEEYILSRSYLPKTSVYTLQEHLMAMLMTIQGSCTSLVIEDEREFIQIKDTLDSISISDGKETIIIKDNSDTHLISDSHDVVIIKEVC